MDVGAGSGAGATVGVGVGVGETGTERGSTWGVPVVGGVDWGVSGINPPGGVFVGV